MEYRKLNYIKNGVNRCGAIDSRSGPRNNFPRTRSRSIFAKCIDIFRSAYYTLDYHNAVVMNFTALQ